MRVLILGCGYVGREVGVSLIKGGHEVFGLTRTAASHAELTAAGIKPLQADVTKFEGFARLPSGFEWVINAVAPAKGGPAEYRQVYLDGATNLLARLAPNPPTKLVYTSSTSVYGQTDGSWVDESSPTQPSSETAQVLLQTEQLLLSFPQTVVLRVAGIYGPERGYWFRQFLRGEAKISGKGNKVLNMIHRDDVAGAIIAALERGQPGQIYNAVDDEPVEQIEFFRWLSEKLGGPLPPFATEEDEITRKRGLTNKRISNRKLTNELGYRFKYPTFREGFGNLDFKGISC